MPVPMVRLEGKQSAAQEVTGSVGAGGNVTGAIDVMSNEVVLLMVQVAPAEAISDFRFQLYAESALSTLLYEFDTSQDSGYVAGAPVRDPNGGYMVVAYAVDLDGGGQLHYRVWNDDGATASTFTIDIDYRPMV